MERIRTTEVQAHVSERVCVQGWLHAVRRLGGVNFLVLRDGWGTVQAVTEQEADLAPITQAELQTESLIALEGLVVASAQAPGGVELQQLQITVLTPVREALPVLISKREVKAQLPVLLDHAVVTNRHPGRRALFRLSAGVMAAFRGYLNSIGFTEIQTPKVVASATESGANVFAIDYFGRPAYLAQSPQFYKQIMVGVFERVFEVGPVFRAEPHATARHLSEYVSMDLELGFIENHFTVMGVLRNLLDHIFTALQSQYSAELALVGANLPTVPTTIPHLHFSEAKELVYQLYGVDERNEPDLSPQEERWLGAWAQSEHGSDFLFVTGYPMSKRPFYTHPDPARPAYSNSFDLLFRGIELVTGGQRLHRYEDYLAALAARKLSTEPFVGYLEAFRYGMPPHGGLAIGLERLLMQLTGAANLRETTLFPRDLSRLTP
jgi:nondiscriminating aspartyl-tRNA synthetase